MPTAVRGTNTATRAERRTTNGVTRQTQVHFARYAIDPADLPAWTGSLTQIAAPDPLPNPPIGANWWMSPADGMAATYYDANPLAGGDSFLAVAPDGSTLYLHAARADG